MYIAWRFLFPIKTSKKKTWEFILGQGSNRKFGAILNIEKVAMASIRWTMSEVTRRASNRSGTKRIALCSPSYTRSLQANAIPEGMQMLFQRDRDNTICNLKFEV